MTGNPYGLEPKKLKNNAGIWSWSSPKKKTFEEITVKQRNLFTIWFDIEIDDNVKNRGRLLTGSDHFLQTSGISILHGHLLNLNECHLREDIERRSEDWCSDLSYFIKILLITFYRLGTNPRDLIHDPFATPARWNCSRKLVATSD